MPDLKQFFPAPSSDQLILAILILLIVAGLVLWLLMAAGRPKFAPKPVLTQNELEFYKRLKKALPDFAIFPQVALRAFIKPRSPSSSRGYGRESSMLGAKHCDFLICCPDTLEVITIIELDDKTHIQAKDAARDAMTRSAGFRTLRFESRRKPSTQEIRALVLKLLNA